MLQFLREEAERWRREREGLHLDHTEVVGRHVETQELADGHHCKMDTKINIFEYSSRFKKKIIKLLEFCTSRQQLSHQVQ